MAMITAMSTRGQIVLPKKIRTALNLGAGTRFLVFSEQGNILLQPITAPQLSEFEAVLEKAKQWAMEKGLQETDISQAVKAVRNKR